MSEIKDITIIGAGPVGLFGAFYAGLRGMTMRLVDSLPEAGGQLVALYPEKFIYDMPGFPEVVAGELAREMVRQAGRFHPEYALGERCESLTRRDEHWVLKTSKAEHPSKTIVICGGIGAFTPTRLGVERESFFEGRGLQYGVHKKEALRDKRVVIVGGGDSAVDWALGLREIAKKITLVHRRDGFRAHEETVQELFAASVNVRLWEVVRELHGEEHLTAVVLENRQTGEKKALACDVLSVNIGYKSALGPIKAWGLELQSNQIKVNAKMETNLPGVYAAGDICTHDGKLELIATGVGEVCTAVNFAKTFIDPSEKAFPGHSTDMELPALPQ